MPRPEKFAVTKEAIAWRRNNRKISDVMQELVNNNISFYTNPEGYYNENYVRTLEVIIRHFGEPD